MICFMHLSTGKQPRVDGRIDYARSTPAPGRKRPGRFRAYDKDQGALAGVPERLREVELRLDGLDETLAMLALAEGLRADQRDWA